MGEHNIVFYVGVQKWSEYLINLEYRQTLVKLRRWFVPWYSYEGNKEWWNISIGVVTEGEYDAMAAYQGTGRPAVSLPNGCRSLPPEVLPLFESFDTIYLWMDDDGLGREGAEKFVKKMGVKRCLIVSPSPSSRGRSVIDGKAVPKDANDTLRAGADM